MTTPMHRHFFLFLAAALAGCSTQSAAPRPEEPSAQTSPQAAAQPEAQPASPSLDHQGPDAKPSAPVDLSLRTSARSGQVIVTLEVSSRSDVQDARVRFVVPSGVSILKGDKEIHAGALRKGETKTFSISLDVPAQGHFSLHAGVDVFPRDGLKLNRTETLSLGNDPPRDPSKVVRLPDGSGIRTAK